jgi:hypothetical protein
MKSQIRHLLFWSPRIICILYVFCFLILFALDVLGDQARFMDKLAAFLIHLSPAALIVVVLIVSWKWEWIGGVIFNVLGLAYWLLASQHIIWILQVSGPLFLIGILFFVGWFYRKEITPE